MATFDTKGYMTTIMPYVSNAQNSKNNSASQKNTNAGAPNRYTTAPTANAVEGQVFQSMKKPAPADSDNGGGGGGSSGASYSAPAVNNYYNDLIAAFESESAAARDNAINAILRNLDALKGTYQGQIKDVQNEYQRLIDENELKKERARRVVRENQANRGQLDSGLGRQEQLNLDTDYNNITSNLNSAKTKAVNDIMNLIAQAEAEAETNKANIRNNYANSLLQFKLANS